MLGFLPEAGSPGQLAEVEHRHPTTKNSDTLRFKTLEGGLMKTRLRSNLAIAVCALLMVNIALAQETLKKDSSTSVTIVTAGDLSVTRAADEDRGFNHFRSGQREVRRHSNYDFRPVLIRRERRREGGERPRWGGASCADS
jgi:hypothetical protein